jgi:hypothetical protein
LCSLTVGRRTSDRGKTSAFGGVGTETIQFSIKTGCLCGMCLTRSFSSSCCVVVSGFVMCLLRGRGLLLVELDP